MPYRTLQRLVAIVSMIIVLIGASSHLLCGVYDVHAYELQSVLLVHEHVLCECEPCPCSVREVTLAVQWKSIDDVIIEPVTFTADWQGEARSTNSTLSTRSFLRPDNTPSPHLRFQKFTVVLI